MQSYVAAKPFVPGHSPAEPVKETMAAPPHQNRPQSEMASEVVGSVSALTSLRQAQEADAIRAQKEESEYLTGAEIKRVLNTMKGLSPLLRALVQKPGVNAEDGELSRVANSMLSEVKRASEELMGMLAIKSDNLWAAKQLTVIAAEAVSAQWAIADNLDLSPFLPAWANIASADFADFNAEFPETQIDPNTALRLSLMKAMVPVIREINVFAFGRNKDDLSKFVSDTLMDTASAACEKMMPANATDESRLMLTQGLLNHAGRLLADHWAQAGKRKVQELVAMTKDERIALKREYPQGFSIEPVLQAFDQDFERLVQATIGIEAKEKPAASSANPQP